MDDKTKEVFFSKYCETCENSKLPETEDPCNECLAQGWNANSHKPIFYKDITGGSLTNE